MLALEASVDSSFLGQSPQRFSK